MQLVLGLGNPGRRYRDTRHNVGFRCLEALAAELELTFDEETPAYRAAVGEGPGGPVTLLQPLTYMNRSGDAVVAWVARHGLAVASEALPTDPDADPEPGDDPAAPPAIVPVVVCDDLHLPLGSIRIRARGSDGGQNGLASVIAACGGDGVPRLRLGVGPRGAAVPPECWADFVLEEFAPDEVEVATELVRSGAAALRAILVDGPQAAGSRHNRRIRAEADLPPGD